MTSRILGVLGAGAIAVGSVAFAAQKISSLPAGITHEERDRTAALAFVSVALGGSLLGIAIANCLWPYLNPYPPRTKTEALGRS